MITYNGGNFDAAFQEAAESGQELLIASGQYRPLVASKVNKPVTILYENVIIDGGLQDIIADIRGGDILHDVETIKKKAALQFYNSYALTTVAPAFAGATITYRNCGRGVAAAGTGGVSHTGGVFHNIIGRAFGGGCHNMLLRGATVSSCVLENFNHRRGRKYSTGGGWAAAVASWNVNGRPAQNFQVLNCVFGSDIWGETVGLFDVHGALVAGNHAYNSSHTVIFYGSSASNVQLLNNSVFVDNRTSPRRDTWRGGAGRLPHLVSIGKEGNDDWFPSHRWEVKGNTLIGGEDGVSISWVESPFVFDADVSSNLIFGQNGESIHARNWDSKISGRGVSSANVLGKEAKLEAGEWEQSGNTILGTSAPAPSPTPDHKRLTVTIDVFAPDAPIKWEAAVSEAPAGVA